jgi:hypothetical protein
MDGYAEQPKDRQLLIELSVNGNDQKGFELVDGVICYKGRVWVGGNKLAQQHILQTLHDCGIGGHSGITTTYNRIKALFAWPHLKATVQSFGQCQVCQQAKVEHGKLPRLLQPLSILEQAW